jgi:hypothetical protein
MHGLGNHNAGIVAVHTMTVDACLCPDPGVPARTRVQS